MFLRLSYRVMLSAILLAGIPAAPSARGAAAAPAAGQQKVEVKWGGQWYPATVLKKEGNRTFIHYDGWGDNFDEWVTPDRIRPAARTTPPPGAAARGGQKPGATTKAAPTESTESEEPTPEAGDWSNVTAAKLDPKLAPAWALKPDPPAGAPKRIAPQPIALYNESGRRQPGRAFHERYTALLFSGPAAGRAILARVAPRAIVEANAGGARTGNLVRLESVDVAVGKSIALSEMPADTNPVDLSPDGTRVLLVDASMGQDGQQRIDVVAIGGRNPEPVASWTPYGQEEDNIFKRRVDWARFVDNTHVLTLNAEGKLALWEIPKPKVLYALETSRASTPALSPGRKYVAVGGDQCVLVIDAGSGKLVGRLADDTWAPVLRFSQDGGQLAVAGGQRLRTWDFATGKARHDLVLPPSVQAREMEWMAGDYVLLDDAYLADLQKQVVLWRYYIDGMRPQTGVHAGRYWYVTGGTRGQGLSLASVALPDEAAKKAAAALKTDQLMAVKPGGKVSLEITIDAPQEVVERVTKSIHAKLKANGLTVADGQPVKLILSTAPGETREVTYQFFGRRSNEKVSISDLKLSITYELEGKPIWQRAQVSGAPAFLSLKENQDVNEAIAQERTRAFGFFDGVSIPRFVPRIPENTTYGASKLTARGAEPGGASGPPPR